MSALFKDKSLYKYDLNDQLEKLKCRSLIIGAEADMVPPSSLDDLHWHLKGSQYVMIEGTGHFPFIEQPKQFRAALDKFFSGK